MYQLGISDNFWLVQIQEVDLWWKKELLFRKKSLFLKKHSTKQYSIFELQELIEFYKKEVEKLKIEKNYDEWKWNH